MDADAAQNIISRSRQEYLHCARAHANPASAHRSSAHRCVSETREVRSGGAPEHAGNIEYMHNAGAPEHACILCAFNQATSSMKAKKNMHTHTQTHTNYYRELLPRTHTNY